MRRNTTTRVIALAALLTLALTGCDSGPTSSPAAATTTVPDDSPANDDSSMTTEPVSAPIIPDEVVAQLDEAIDAESDPIATTSEQTEGLPEGATLDVLQLDQTESGGYLLRVRLSWPEETTLSPLDERRSLSLDGESVFVDGIRLVDGDSGRFTLPTVYAPQDQEQIDDTERFRCLCSDLVSRVPPEGQILGALYGPLGDDEAQPETLSVEVPGFEPITDVPVAATG